MKKRPRRRYDETERLYACSWPDCTKQYGISRSRRRFIISDWRAFGSHNCATRWLSSQASNIKSLPTVLLCFDILSPSLSASPPRTCTSRRSVLTLMPLRNIMHHACYCCRWWREQRRNAIAISNTVTPHRSSHPILSPYGFREGGIHWSCPYHVHVVH